MFDRDEQEISQIIETGIEAILTGRSTLEEVLAEHPMQAEEIRGELEGALWLTSRQQEVEARSGFVSASRKRVIERIKAEASSQGTRRAFFGFAWPQRLAFQWAAAAAVILMLFLGAGGLVTVSANSLPGDELYAVKRAAEHVAYTVTLSDVKRVELSAQFANRRLNEVESLMAKGNYGAVQGTIQEYDRQVSQTVALLQKVSDAKAGEKLSVAVAFKEDLWQQATLLAGLQTTAPQSLRGDLLQAADIVDHSTATASDIIIELPNPTATPTLTPTPTETATPLDTSTPVFTDTPLPSRTPRDPTMYGPTDEPDPSETLTPWDASRTPRPERTVKPKNVPQGKQPIKPDKPKNKPPGKNK